MKFTVCSVPYEKSPWPCLMCDGEIRLPVGTDPKIVAEEAICHECANAYTEADLVVPADAGYRHHEPEDEDGA